MSKEKYEALSEREKIAWAEHCNIWYEPIGDWSQFSNIPTFDPKWFDLPTPKHSDMPDLDFAKPDERSFRAIKYLQKVPGAVSGSGGNQATFIAACRLVKNFDLSESTAFTILRDVFNPKCQPPWSDAQLMTFIKNAARYGKGGRHE